ncbi:MAG: flagellar export protein FliJ [Firmicutes bacterium]|jgi:flagellar FliJ protein|nr:flagellar export protein FliJ [Bacillota bacterium]MDH7495397.1 flagellar export protein FliJ [Bacillota bacterium]
MKRFRFRLEKLLEVRRLRENALQQDLARAQEALRREKGVLETLGAARGATLEALRANVCGTLNVQDIAAYYRYLGFLAHRIEEQRAVVERAAREEAAKRDALIAARRRRKVVEKLRERAYARYREGILREEQAFLDEVGSMRYARKGGEDLSGNVLFRALGPGEGDS